MIKRMISVVLSFAILLLSAFVPVSALETEGASIDNPKTEWVTALSKVNAYPPKDTHPRVFFRSSDIGRIKENIESEEAVYAFSDFNTQANTEIKVSGSATAYSDSVISNAECKALYYAIYKDDVNEEKKADAVIKGNEAVAAIDIISNFLPVGQDVSRKYGRMIQVISEIYDWCYDLLPDEETKNAIIEKIISIASGTHVGSGGAVENNMEIGWPPNGQSAVTSHGSEAQLLRDLMCFAIAAYDERPELWNYIGGRFYAEYVPVRQTIDSAGFYHQGSDYGSYRQTFTDYAYVLMTGMGLDEPYNHAKINGYGELYMRRPDGTVFTDGDVYSNAIPPFTYLNNSSDGMLLKAYITGDPYLKNEYFKRTVYEAAGAFVQYFNDNSSVMFLLFNRPDVKAKSRDSLPLSKYFGSPAGVMFARTGWSEGKNADSAAVMMKIGEKRFNNHQHLDSGSFQIYYKGLLAGEGGKYNLYGDQEHNMYTSKSIAHNTMLVFDPEEGLSKSDSNFSKRYNIIDGGQKAWNNYNEVLNIGDLEGSDVATVIGQEIDRENPQNPLYTYIKGDLKNAYTDKVSGFERSFMFLNFSEEEEPAALIVFDRVESSNPQFRKSWILHSSEKAEINGSRSFIKRENFGYEGKMMLDTLLPAKTDLNVETIGQEGKWGIVRQYKYNDTTKKWDVTDETNYASSNAKGSELNSYRLEISPKTAKKEDYFFNVITIGGDNNSEVPELKEDINGNFYGTEIKDRVVYFSKNSNESEHFAIKGSAGIDSNLKYTICGMKPGTYKVTAGNETILKDVTEDGGVLSFEVPASCDINAVWINDDFVSAGEILPDESKGNEYYINIDGAFYNIGPVEQNENGNVIVSAEKVCSVTGNSITKNGEIYVLKDKAGNKIVEIIPNNPKIRTPRGNYTMIVTPFEENEHLMMEVEDICALIDAYGTHNSQARAFYSRIYDTTEDIYHTAFFKNGKLCVRACVNYARDIENFICGIYDENMTLISTTPMTEYSDGRWMAEFDFSEYSVSDVEKFRIKTFIWDENISPFTNFVSVDVNGKLSHVSALYSVIDRSILFSTRYNFKDENGKSQVGLKASTVWASSAVTFEKVHEYPNEVNSSVTFPNNSKYPLGDENAENRYIHYSAYVKIIKLSSPNEMFQLRARGEAAYETSKSTTTTITLPSVEGYEYKMDCIIDLYNRVTRAYINGELYATDSDYSHITNIYNLHFYFTGSKGAKGGKVTVFDPLCIVYPKDTEYEDIINGIGRTIYIPK